MGEMADYYTDEGVDYDIGAYYRPPRRVRPSKPGFWTTAAGRTLEIREMDDEHIDNCIAMIYRKAMGAYVDKYHELVAEQRRRRRNESQRRRRRQQKPVVGIDPGTPAGDFAVEVTRVGNRITRHEIISAMMDSDEASANMGRPKGGDLGYSDPLHRWPY